MNEIAQLVSQVGFPIVVALYALIRLDTTIRENTRVIVAIGAKLDVEGTQDGNGSN